MLLPWLGVVGWMVGTWKTMQVLLMILLTTATTDPYSENSGG